MPKNSKYSWLKSLYRVELTWDYCLEGMALTEEYGEKKGI